MEVVKEGTMEKEQHMQKPGGVNSVVGREWPRKRVGDSSGKSKSEAGREQIM